MSDPRNVQHDKKVMQEKKHHGEDLAKGAAHVPQPGKKMAVAEKKPAPPEEHPATPEDSASGKGE